MAKAKLTIAIGGEYTGSAAIRRAESELKALRTEARQMDGATGELMKFGDACVDLGSSMERTGASISSFGTTVTKITAPIAIAGAACVKLASDYEDAVAKVYTIMDKSVMSTDDMAKSILDLSTKTGKSATELADATYQALSASVATDKVAGFVEQSVNLAKAGFTSTTSAVDALTTVINAYKLNVEDATEISDKLVQAQNDGKTTVDELAASMGTIIPTAAALNVNLDNVLSSYAIMTKQGIKTTDATTALKNTLSELSDEGSTVATILQEKTGKSFGQLMSDGWSLGDVLEILYESVDGNSEAFKNLWGNMRAGTGALAIASVGAEGFTSEMDKMEDSTGNVSEALEDLQTPSAKAGKALNAVKNTGIQLGEEILSAMVPSIEKLSNMAQSLYNWFKNLDEGTKQNIVRFGGLAVAIGPVLTIFGKLYSGVGSLITHFGKGIQSIGAFSAAMKTAETNMRNAGASTVTFGDKVKAAAEKTGRLTSATNLLKGGLVSLGIGAAVTLIGTIVGALMEWKEHTDKVTKATTGLEDAAKKATAAYDKYEPAIEGATKALELNGVAASDALESQSQLADKMNETWKDVNTDAAMIDYYAGVIGELGNKGGLTKTEFEKLKVAVDEYNRLTGDSVEITDSETGALSKSTEAILKHAEAYKEEARQAAARELLIETNKQMITDELALEDAKTKLNEAEKKQQEYMKQYPGLANPYDTEVRQLNQDIAELEAEHASCKKSIDSMMGVISETPSHFTSMENALASCGLSLEDLGDVTDEQLAIMDERFDGTLRSIYDTCVEQGIAIPEGLANGISQTSGEPTDAARAMVDTMMANMRRILGISSPSRVAYEIGRNVDLGLKGGIDGNTSFVTTAANLIVSGVTGRLSTLPNSASTYGRNSTVGFVNGMNSLGVGKYAQNIAVTARNGLKSVETYNTGHNFTVGFVNGMNGVDLYNYAWNLASRAVRAVKNCLGVASPSKEAAKIGQFFGEGLVLGMQDTEGAVEAEVQRMGSLMGFEPAGYSGLGGTGYGAQASPSYTTMNVTINVTASNAAEARAVGTSLADGLYEEITRRQGSELWPVSYSAA